MSSVSIWFIALSRKLEEALCEQLFSSGIVIIRCNAVEDFEKKVSHNECGVIVISSSCFSKGDFEFLASLRLRFPKLAIIIVCNDKQITSHEIASYLEAGADDFVPNTMHEAVLAAKIKAILRRVSPFLDPSTYLETSDKHIRVNRKNRRIWVKSKNMWKELDNLTPKEFDLIAFLIEKVGTTLGRNLILEAVWKEKADAVNAEIVDKHVEALRRKLGRYGKKIKTVYGLGYCLKPEEQTVKNSNPPLF